jgi:deazaflavin-dependent oxidoreductase (nitroreductase family)
MTATLEPVPVGTPPTTPLPYSPRIEAVLGPMHAAFRALSTGLSVPLISAGLGSLFSNPLTGSQLVLRTTGRRSGRRRAVALGYTILDGGVYVAAGWGEATRWYMNLVADPRVEIVLPGGTAFAGTAETVTERVELLRAWRRLLTDLGVIGRGFVTDPRTASDELLLEKTTGIPLVRIRPTGIAAGPSDPGGLAWVALQAVTLGVTVAVVRRAVAVARRAVACSGREAAARLS